jgi:hypothetical protein
VLASTVAIIHSGGDSRRSPLHSVSGKAWSSLNSGEGEGDCVLASPLTVLLTELTDLARRLPPPNCHRWPAGSVIVASADVLVSLELPGVSDAQTD